jgi:hypothetical protein
MEMTETAQRPRATTREPPTTGCSAARSGTEEPVLMLKCTGKDFQRRCPVWLIGRVMGWEREGASLQLINRNESLDI